MARNKLTDLNNHLFAQLERLNDESLTPDQINAEAVRAKASSGIASQIINVHKLALEAQKLVATNELRASELPESFGVKVTNMIKE